MKVSQVLCGVLLVATVPALALQGVAQNPDTLMPEQSAAKGKQILDELINGLGGRGYTDVRESECSGRLATFGHDGGLMGYIDFNDFRHLPDKMRIEYVSKGRNTILQSLIGVDGLDFKHGGIVITLYNGDHGWTYDSSGVTELPVTAVDEFREQVERNIDILLRVRLNEPGMEIRFGGNDLVDLKKVNWVELTDTGGRKFRLAVDRSTHYLVRAVVSTQDSEFNQINEDVTIYANYQLKESVWTPMQVTHEHNGRRVSHFFYDTCRYNPGFPDDLFSKTSLQKHGSGEALKRR